MSTNKKRLSSTNEEVRTDGEKRDNAPPRCTRDQLLAVACPTCGAAVGSYCEERPGKVLLLPHHHADRFWAASAAGCEIN